MNLLLTFKLKLTSKLKPLDSVVISVNFIEILTHTLEIVNSSTHHIRTKTLRSTKLANERAIYQGEATEMVITWHISHLGSLVERHWRRSLWCLLASLFAAWTSTSHVAQSAASSAQQITVAGAFSQTSHCIFIFSFWTTTPIFNKFPETPLPPFPTRRSTNPWTSDEKQ